MDHIKGLNAILTGNLISCEVLGFMMKNHGSEKPEYAD
jgi:hypothetical protein